jgi:hypothetical protein
MVVTMQHNIIDAARKDTHYRIPIVFPQLVSGFDMSHKNAFASYLKAKNYIITEAGNIIKGTKDNNVIEGSFDELGRLTNLTG